MGQLRAMQIRQKDEHPDAAHVDPVAMRGDSRAETKSMRTWEFFRKP